MHFLYSEIKIECQTLSRQPGAAIIPYHHTVGENRLALIDPVIITKSFKKCSISNYLDGTEDRHKH